MVLCDHAGEAYRKCQLVFVVSLIPKLLEGVWEQDTLHFANADCPPTAQYMFQNRQFGAELPNIKTTCSGYTVLPENIGV